MCVCVERPRDKVLKIDVNKSSLCVEIEREREREESKEGKYKYIYLQVLTVFSLYILETHTLLLRIQKEAKIYILIPKMYIPNDNKKCIFHHDK